MGGIPAEVLSLNVLPVLADLSSPKPDLPARGVGSSAGDFAHILDQTLSRTPSTGSFVGAGPGAPNAPYLSPARQNPEPRQQPASTGDTQSFHENPASHQAAQAEASRSEGARSHQSERNAASRHEPPNNEQGTSKTNENGTRSSEKASQSKPGGKATDKQSANESKSAAADKSNAAKKAQHDNKQEPHPAKNGAAGVPFPGALILAGAHKGEPPAGNQGNSKLKKLGSELELTTKLLKGAQAAKDAKKTAAETTAKAAKKAQSKNQKTNSKHGTTTGAVPAQLLSAPLTTSNNTAAPQNLGAAVHNGSTHPNAQQDPNGAAGHNTTASQTAGVTIIDLRQHNENGGSSSGQSNGQSHSNDGGNIRLFQLADGGSAGSIKMNGQAGMARAGGAASSGQSFSAFTDQIVKQTGILLKNNNSGEIRLVLKPEHLGNMRIKLDLNNNSLSGKIFVQNHEALKLVQQNLDTLYRALRDSGFTATELNVSVGGRDNGEKNRERSSPLPSMRAISGVKGFDNQAPALEAAGSYYSLVNLVI